MEILQTIWTALTTPNELLINIATSILTFVEVTVVMLLFTSILNISGTKKQKLIYIISISIITIIDRYFVLYPYGTFINIFAGIIAVKFIFKTNLLKSLIALIIPFVVTVILETIFSKLYLFLFDIAYEIGYTLPWYRLSIMLFIYLSIFILYLITKKFKLNIVLLDTLAKRNNIVLIFTYILGFISIATQLYITIFYSKILPVQITLLSIIGLIGYFFISMYSLNKTNKLEIANQDIENLQLYNKTLAILHDNIRAFKHDFNNIVQAIGGYVTTGDIEGLRSYYSQLLADCQQVNSLAALNPSVINNPSLYSLFASKYHLADSKGIKINFEIFLDLNNLHMKIYELTRVLGILLDNSIEACEECNEKIINVIVRKAFKSDMQLVIIENTYKNKDIDTEKIFEKAYTTKPNNTGLGLWEVRQILRKNNNLNLFTSKDDTLFKQQLEIYPLPEE